MNTIGDFLNLEGFDYTIRRGSTPDRVETGLPGKDSNFGLQHISFMPETDIKAGDILLGPNGENFCVSKTEMEYFQKQPYALNAYYSDGVQGRSQESSAVYNIQNAYGSIIGSGNQATVNYNSAISELKQAVSSDTSADKEQLEKIVSLLEMVVNDQVPPSKGLFSKFREVMERNSWITGSIANALMNWLLSKTL